MTPYLWKQTFGLLGALVTVACSNVCFGQLRDGFEGGPPRWQLAFEDAKAKLTSQFPQLSPLQPHFGQASERIDYTCSHGTSVQFAYPLDPTAIIEDVRATLWVRSPVAGIRPAFRVVFPRTGIPLSRAPLTTLLYGAPSKEGGRWEQLTLSNPEKQLVAREPSLRLEFGSDIDLRGAYIDAIVLETYNGPGVTRLQIDDLAIDAMVRAQDIAAPPSDPSLAENTPESAEAVTVRMSERLSDLQRGVPRWIQYRGESLNWLKTLRVTGLVLDAPMSNIELAEARRAGLQVLSPPPATTPPANEWQNYDAVQGWLLGSALDSSHIAPSRELSQRLVQLPTRLLRPTLAEAMEDHWGYSRIADMLAVPAPLATSVDDGREMVTALSLAYQKSRGRTVPLTSLTIQASREWVEQQEGLQEAIGKSQFEVPAFDPLQARLRIYRTIAAGARGWYFRSQTPLDSGDEADTKRAKFFEHIGEEIEWLSPWIQAAATPVAIDDKNIPGYQGTIHSLPNSHLILLIASDKYDSMCAAAPTRQALEFPVPGFTSSAQVFRLSQGRLEPILSKLNLESASCKIDRPGFIEILLVTRDERVINYVRERSERTSRTLFETHSMIAEHLEKLTQYSLNAEQVPPNNPSWNRVRGAAEPSRQSMFMLQRGDVVGAVEAIERSTIAYQGILRESWLRALSQFPSPHSSPWIETIVGLPQHWELNRLLDGRPWTRIDIPGAMMESPNSIWDASWGLDRRLEERVSSQVSVEASAGPDGSSAMRFTANSIRGQSVGGGFEGSCLRLFSPALLVSPGSLVRIDCLVKVIRNSQTPQAGLLVYDSVGGPASGQLVRLDPEIPAGQWQRVSLHRLVHQQDGIRVMMEMRGEGEFLVDQIEASLITPSMRSTYPMSMVEQDQQVP